MALPVMSHPASEDCTRRFSRKPSAVSVSSDSSWTGRESGSNCASWADIVDEDGPGRDRGFAVDSELGSGLPSTGSGSHAVGRCKPCAFFHTKGCQSGASCLFCHLCPPRERQRRKQQLRRMHRHPRDRTSEWSAGTSKSDVSYEASWLCSSSWTEGGEQEEQEWTEVFCEESNVEHSYAVFAPSQVQTAFPSISLVPLVIPCSAPSVQYDGIASTQSLGEGQGTQYWVMHLPQGSMNFPETCW